MKLIGKQPLRDFTDRHTDARPQVEAWEAEAESAQWLTPHELKNRYPKVSILKSQNVIFDICGNRYRLWVKISYNNQTILIKKIGTHKEYDKWKII